MLHRAASASASLHLPHWAHDAVSQGRMMADLSIGSRPDRRIRLQSVHVFAVAAAGALAAQRDGLFVVCWSVVYGLTPRQACGVFV
jgi:hypothetical protein